MLQAASYNLTDFFLKYLNRYFFQPQRQNAFVYDNPNHHHVYKIVEVTGRPYYGYHAREHRFAKIYFYNPYDLRKASDFLGNLTLNFIVTLPMLNVLGCV